MQLLVFLLLKIVEVSAILFIPYELGKLLSLIPFMRDKMFFVDSKGEMWLMGFLGICVLFISFLLLMLICISIQANWVLAGRILNK